jgi:hypothetical protein
MRRFIFLAIINTLPIYKKQASTYRDHIRNVDGLPDFPYMQYNWMVPHELVEICSKLRNSKAVQNLGVDTDFQLVILYNIQPVALDFRAIVLFCSAWP